MIIPFKYWLHDDYTAGEFEDEILRNNLRLHEQGIDTEALMQKMGRPFYEVTLECTLDTDTGEVKILSSHS